MNRDPLASSDSRAAAPFGSFAEFYPFYLGEHDDVRCRRLHFAGTTLVIATLVYALASGHYGALWLLPLFGYGFAWVGHFFFERNRPATFKAPVYSFLGDFRMYGDILRGRVSLRR